MKKRLSLILLLTALLTLPVSAVNQPVPLLSWTDDPTTTITAAWTAESAQRAEMQIIRETDYEKTAFASAVSVPAKCWDISLDGSGVWHYEVTATGLTPSTAYVYRVGSAVAWSEPRHFTTAAGDDFITFAYMGDVQPEGDAAKAYAEWGKLTKSVCAVHPELSFAVLGGDIVNSGISQAQFDLFSQYASPVFGSVPLFSTAGNHESNFPSGKPELFLDTFAFPKNGPTGFEEEFYSFDCGNVHMTVLNSWIFSGEQKLTDADFERIVQWLKHDLASSAADWKIVVTHLPVYAVHGDANADKMRNAWSAIFEEYGVDLVLVGHQHVYSRSYPLTQGAIDYENGITYIMGVSGSKFYSSADETFAERTIYNTATCQLIRADGDSLTVQTLDADGNELDFVSIPQRSGAQTRLAYITKLWQAAGYPASAKRSPFADSDDPAVRWAYEKKLVFGYGNGLFGTDDLITDWQIALIQNRMEAQF